MKTDSEFIGSVYHKIAEKQNRLITPKKSKPLAGTISMAAAAACIICAVVFIPGLFHPALKDGTIPGTAVKPAETGAAEYYRFEGISPKQLCETYNLSYNVFYPDYYLQTENLNTGMQTAVSGVGLKIAYPSEWTYGNKYDTTINVDRLLYKLIPVQISLSEKPGTVRIINDYLTMLYGSEPDITVERMKNSTVYYCIQFPGGPPTGEISDTELEAYYNQAKAYFFCELDSGYILRFLLLSTKDKIDYDATRYLAMLSTAEITEGDPYHFNIDLPMDSYALVMSSAPGLPFTVHLNTVHLNNEANIRITADGGTLLTWGDTGVVKPFANDGNCTAPVTLYWSPLEGGSDMTDQSEGIAATITVTVYTPQKQEGKREITITSDGFYYYADVSEFSYTR